MGALHQTTVIIAAMLFAVMAGGAKSFSADSPNVLVIVADDLGFSDLGCYGGEIATPHLDALAADGLQFTDFYNTARCWPTRSALLTGYYPQQIRRDLLPGSPTKYGVSSKRPKWARTIAEHLRPAGYRSYHSGKWHVDGKPLDNGFDRSDETTRAPGFFDSIGRPHRDPDFYRTTATADHAIECLQTHDSSYADAPFFQYVAFHAPHFPLHALPEDIERYRNRYLAGWDALRMERHQRQREQGIVVGELSSLEPRVGPPYDFGDQLDVLGPGEITRPIAWNELTKVQQRFQAAKMSIHAAMVDRMDQEIGRILDQLRSMNAMDNTLIMFLSDNGASAELMVRGEGHDPRAAMGSAATYLCLGPGFSSAANTPFRRHKTWVHEGGISTPFIAHWPAGIVAKGERRETVAHVIDLAPTILKIAGVDPLHSDAPPFPGTSLKPAFADDNTRLHDELWFYHEGNRGLRQGDWKLVSGDQGRDFPWRRSESAAGESEAVPWSLYDLSSDRAEQDDLSSTQTERVERMAARWSELSEQFLRDSQ